MIEYLRPLARKLSGLVRRGVLTAVNDGAKAQGVQVLVGDGVVRGPVEYLQAYGFTSQALAGADVILLNVGGSADLPVCIVVSDRRGRVKVAPGESAQWDDQGQVIAIRRAGIVIDAAGRPDGIKLGAAATAGVARVGDPVSVASLPGGAPNPADPWVVWFTAINALVPGCPAVPLPGVAVPPLGEIAGGSATVTAAD